ncbi:MAG: YqcC family protein [Gammaproteobacteria bacterium]
MAEIEFELRRLDLWLEAAPTAEALSSSLPFCHDTLDFPQWLQFVFLKRISVLLETAQTLPTVCGIFPYAEEYFRGSDIEAERLLDQLAKIDKLLTTEK